MGRVTSAGPAPSCQSMWSPTSSGAGLLATGRAVEPRVGSRRSLEILIFPWNSHHTLRAGNEIQLRHSTFGSFQSQSYRGTRMSQSHGSVRLSWGAWRLKRRAVCPTLPHYSEAESRLELKTSNSGGDCFHHTE